VVRSWKDEEEEEEENKESIEERDKETGKDLILLVFAITTAW